MSAVTTPLTIEQFREQYGDSDRIEFWDGEVVEKAMPTFLHSLVQRLLLQLLDLAGFCALPELRMQIGSRFEPVPDIAAGRTWIDTPYPTRADEIEIVVEVLSPKDRHRDVVEKCQFYQSIGIGLIYVVNPIARRAYRWQASSASLLPVEEWLLPNNHTLLMTALWSKVDAEKDRLRRRP